MSHLYNHCWLATAIALSFLLPNTTLAQARAIVLKMKNPAGQAYQIRVSADRNPPVYRHGEAVKLRVKANRDAHLLVLTCTEGNPNAECLFPNKFQQNSFVKANEQVTIPAASAEYEFAVAAPYGTDIVHVIATKQPLNELNLKLLQQAAVAQLSLKQLRQIWKELQQTAPNEWAEDTVLIQTKPAGEPLARVEAQTSSRKRISLHFGLSYIEDRGGFRNSACVKDAQAGANVLQEKAGFSAKVIVNKDATRERVLGELKALEQQTEPGDIIAIHWSGSYHYRTSRKVDALVPFNAEMATSTGRDRTLIHEGELAEILGRLKGRTVLCLFETYKYRQLELSRGAVTDPIFADLVDKMGTRPGGQPNLVLIESCRRAQTPHAHRVSQLSVMTHYFLTELERPEGNRPVGEIFQQLTDGVETYVRRTYRGDTQHPSISYHGSRHFSLKD